ERLAAAARAAPVVGERRAEQLPVARAERDIVQLRAVARMLRAEDAIPQRALVILRAHRIAGPLEHVARELEHVVGDTAFLRVAAELGRQHARLGAPALAVARAAGGVGAPLGDLTPEVLGDVPVARLRRELVAPGGADDLGDGGVDVEALELVAARG